MIELLVEAIRKTSTEWTETPCAVVYLQVGEDYVIKLSHGPSSTDMSVDEIPNGVRLGVIWTIVENHAYIKIPVKASHTELLADLMLDGKSDGK